MFNLFTKDFFKFFTGFLIILLLSFIVFIIASQYATPGL
jgi:hypothetical protein